jgi:hypothetical protein
MKNATSSLPVGSSSASRVGEQSMRVGEFCRNRFMPLFDTKTWSKINRVGLACRRHVIERNKQSLAFFLVVKVIGVI